MKTIFISYSRKDTKWKDRLASHLGVLEDQNLCRLWHDRDISMDQDWFPEINAALNQAHMAIMLITKDFLGSDFIKKEEIPRILERREKGELMAVPLFIMPCAWKQVDWLQSIQGFPADGQALAKRKEVYIDEKLAEFTNIVAGWLKGNTDGNPFDRTGPASAPLSWQHRGKCSLLTRLPYRKIDLIGREMELTEIANRLQNTRRVLLVNGLGGIGKTEVCKTFFLEHYRHYAYAGWIDCVSTLAESVVSAFKKLACPQRHHYD